MLSLLCVPTFISIHDYWENHSFDYTHFCSQSDVSAFFMVPRFVIEFLPRSKRLLISWQQSSFAVILEPKKIKFVTVYTFSSCICHEVMGPGCHNLSFLMLSFKPAFSLSPFTLIKGSLVSPHFLALEWCYLHIWGCWYFSWKSWFQLIVHPAQHFTWCTLYRS